MVARQPGPIFLGDDYFNSFILNYSNSPALAITNLGDRASLEYQLIPSLGCLNVQRPSQPVEYWRIIIVMTRANE